VVYWREIMASHSFTLIDHKPRNQLEDYKREMASCPNTSGISPVGHKCKDCKDMVMFYMGEVELNDEQAEEEAIKFDDNQMLQEAEHQLQCEHTNCGICPGYHSLSQLQEVCLTCAMVGIWMRHSIPLTNLFEDTNEVHAMDNNAKPMASKWLVDSSALVHVTND